MSNGQVQREEDLFAHTRMDLGSHIEELRGCLWRALKWFLLAMVVGVLVAQPVLAFIQAPLVLELKRHHHAVLEKLVAQSHEDGGPLGEWVPLKIHIPREGLPAGLRGGVDE